MSVTRVVDEYKYCLTSDFLCAPIEAGRAFSIPRTTLTNMRDRIDDEIAGHKDREVVEARTKNLAEQISRYVPDEIKEALGTLPKGLQLILDLKTVSPDKGSDPNVPDPTEIDWEILPVLSKDTSLALCDKFAVMRLSQSWPSQGRNRPNGNGGIMVVAFSEFHEDDPQSPNSAELQRIFNLDTVKHLCDLLETVMKHSAFSPEQIKFFVSPAILEIFNNLPKKKDEIPVETNPNSFAEDNIESTNLNQKVEEEVARKLRGIGETVKKLQSQLRFLSTAELDLILEMSCAKYDVIYLISHSSNKGQKICKDAKGDPIDVERITTGLLKSTKSKAMDNAPIILLNLCQSGLKLAEAFMAGGYAAAFGPRVYVKHTESHALFLKILRALCLASNPLPNLIRIARQTEIEPTNQMYSLYCRAAMAYLPPLDPGCKSVNFCVEKQFEFFFHPLEAETGDVNITNPKESTDIPNIRPYYLNLDMVSREELIDRFIHADETEIDRTDLVSLPMIQAMQLATSIKDMIILGTTFSPRVNCACLSRIHDLSEKTNLDVLKGKTLAVDGFDMLPTFALAESLNRHRLKVTFKNQYGDKKPSEERFSLPPELKAIRESGKLKYGSYLFARALDESGRTSHLNEHQSQDKDKIIMENFKGTPDLVAILGYVYSSLIYSTKAHRKFLEAIEVPSDVDKNNQEVQLDVLLKPFEEHLSEFRCACGKSYGSQCTYLSGIFGESFLLGAALVTRSSDLWGGRSLGVANALRVIIDATSISCGESSRLEQYWAGNTFSSSRVAEIIKGKEGGLDPGKWYSGGQMIHARSRLFVELEIRRVWNNVLRYGIPEDCCCRMYLPRAGDTFVLNSPVDLIPFVVAYGTYGTEGNENLIPEPTELQKRWSGSGISIDLEFVKEIIGSMTNPRSDYYMRDFSILLMKSLDYLGDLAIVIQHFMEVKAVPRSVSLQYLLLLEEVRGIVQQAIKRFTDGSHAMHLSHESDAVVDLLDAVEVMYRCLEQIPQISLLCEKVNLEADAEEVRRLEHALRKAFPFGDLLDQIMLSSRIIPNDFRKESYPLLKQFSKGIDESLPKHPTPFLIVIKPKASAAKEALDNNLNLLGKNICSCEEELEIRLKETYTVIQKKQKGEQPTSSMISREEDLWKKNVEDLELESVELKYKLVDLKTVKRTIKDLSTAPQCYCMCKLLLNLNSIDDMKRTLGGDEFLKIVEVLDKLFQNLSILLENIDLPLETEVNNSFERLNRAVSDYYKPKLQAFFKDVYLAYHSPGVESRFTGVVDEKMPEIEKRITTLKSKNVSPELLTKQEKSGAKELDLLTNFNLLHLRYKRALRIIEKYNKCVSCIGASEKKLVINRVFDSLKQLSFVSILLGEPLDAENPAWAFLLDKTEKVELFGSKYVSYSN